MRADSFLRFETARNDLKARILEWTLGNPGLPQAQRNLQTRYGHAPYPVETPIVYNRALDEVSASSDIRIVLVADNPGIQEQKEANRSYLVGQSGKLAVSFFRDVLGMDFRKEVLILNKTPVHTPRTRELESLGAFLPLLEESQQFMAGAVSEIAEAFSVPVWIIGYSELAKKRLFSVFAAAYAENAMRNGIYQSTFVFRHFSMNQFSADFKARSKSSLDAMENLSAIGTLYRDLHLGPYLTR